MRILVVEDEKELCDAVAAGLRLDGYETDACYDGEEGLELGLTESYDLIVLDLNLPSMDGMQVLEEIRKENQTVPILILSARGGIPDKVQGLDLGANDYMVKPFHFEELEARIRSLTRRQFVQEQVRLTYGEISFDTDSRTATVRGEELKLTRKEAGLLEYFMLNSNRIISQEEMLQHLWDRNADEFSNSVRVHISALRKKLFQKLGYDPIRNKIGQGYTLKGEEE